MQIYDFKQIYEELKKKLSIVETKTAGLDEEINRLNEDQQNPEVWSDLEKVADINRRLKILTQKQESVEKVRGYLADFAVTIEFAESDPSEFSEAELEQARFKADELLQELWIETLLSGEYDSGSAVISLHAGAGGEEAQDWTDMLRRMYTRFAEKEGYECRVLDYLYGDGAGYKSVTLLMEGKHAYGNMKCERGVHRLVRISPFDANKRRHTSFASLEVSPIIDDTTEIEIRPDEIKVDTYRAGGAGGQHINKTESAVRITHIPTGIIVACQNERSQTQNREYAMKMLYAKLAEKAEKEKEDERLKQLGLQRKIEWGSQIRSYVLCPYNMVKDHRTEHETGDTDAVLDGDIKQFIIEKLKQDKIGD